MASFRRAKVASRLLSIARYTHVGRRSVHINDETLRETYHGECQESSKGPGFRTNLAFRAICVVDCALLQHTVEMYGVHGLDIADTYLVASVERTGVGVVASFDRGIDRVGTVLREEPS